MPGGPVGWKFKKNSDFMWKKAIPKFLGFCQGWAGRVEVTKG